MRPTTFAIGLFGAIVIVGCDRDRHQPSSVTETRSGEQDVTPMHDDPAPPPAEGQPKPTAQARPIDTGTRLRPVEPEPNHAKDGADGRARAPAESNAKAAVKGDLPAFEGELKMNVAGGAPESLDYALKGDKIRIGLSGAPGKKDQGIDAIIDTDDKKAIVLLKDRKQYVEVDLAKLGSKAKNRLENVRVEKSGGTDTVSGKTCERWKIVDKDVEVNACVTKGAPYFDLEALEQQGGFRAPAWIRGVIDAGYVPLRVSIVDRKGGKVAGARVTDMSTNNVDEQQFQVPAGFTKTTLSKAGIPK